MKTSELASFAVESVRSQVTTLNPSHFNLEENLPVNQDKPWFIDFFAPVSLLDCLVYFTQFQ